MNVFLNTYKLYLYKYYFTLFILHYLYLKLYLYKYYLTLHVLCAAIL